MAGQPAASVVIGARQLRLAIAAMGVGRLQRVALGLRVVTPAMAGVVTSGVLVACVAPMVGLQLRGDIGWAWTLPLAGPLVVIVGLGANLPRPPR